MVFGEEAPTHVNEWKYGVVLPPRTLLPTTVRTETIIPAACVVERAGMISSQSGTIWRGKVFSRIVYGTQSIQPYGSNNHLICKPRASYLGVSFWYFSLVRSVVFVPIILNGLYFLTMHGGLKLLNHYHLLKYIHRSHSGGDCNNFK